MTKSTQNKKFTVYQVMVTISEIAVRPWKMDKIKTRKINEGLVTQCEKWSRPQFFVTLEEAEKIAKEKSNVTKKQHYNRTRGQFYHSILTTTCEIQPVEFATNELPYILKVCSCGCNIQSILNFDRQYGISMDNFKVNEDHTEYIFEE